MVDYPKDIPSFGAALLAYTLPATPEGVAAEIWETVGARLDEAKAKASPVDRMVGVLDALKTQAAHLDEDGLKLLAGAAYLVAAQNFHGKGPEAVPALLAAVAALG